MRSLAALVVAVGVMAPVGAQQPAVSVPDLLERVAAYLTTFEKDYARVIADERYKQDLREKRVIRTSDKTVVRTREIRADILAAPDSGNRWLNVRDVYSVDGAKVRDRDSRLEKLFAGSGANKLLEARRIADEGARFNLGTVVRNTNLPAMPLTFITSENRARSAFKITGQERVGDADTVVLAFEETVKPTLVRSGTNNLVARGAFWIEPVSGRVMKARVGFEARLFTTEMTVTFGFFEKLAMWVPIEMAEKAENPTEIVTGFAVYTNYRRFDTSMVIK